MLIRVKQLAGDDQSVVADQGVAGSFDALLAVGREGQLCGAGVAPVKGPLRLAVADYEDAGRSHWGGLSKAGALLRAGALGCGSVCC